MSAFQVKEEIIQKVVAILTLGEYMTDTALQELGQSLTNMNDRAVSTRYNESETTIPYNHRHVYIDRHAVSMGDPKVICPLLKSLDCFLYQCTEGEVPTERLYKRCQEARERLASQLIDNLPEYREADWG